MMQQAAPVQDKRQQPSTIAVRYGFLGWVGQFRHDPSLKLKYSDLVVVKTERGLEIGTPMSCSCAETCPKFVRPEQTEAYIRASGEDHLQRNAGEIVRVATAEDLAEQRRIDAQAKEKITFCSHAAVKANLEMDVIACEHLLGGERIIFYFAAEGRIDFRQLVRELAREYHTRIEMRQIGARDEARIVADFEICGRECCCKNFLKVLRPVNMKMAKMQKATLDPTKVSGRCGRLRCCLRYEQQTYEELDAKLPDIGIRVQVEQGIGIIRERQVITQLLVLDMGEGRRLAVPLEEIKEILGPVQGDDAPSRRRPRDRTGEPGGEPPARGPGRGEQDDSDEQQAAGYRSRGQDDEDSDAPAPRRTDVRDDQGPSPAGRDPRAEQPAAQGQQRQGQEPRRGRRGRPDGRRGRDGGGRPPAGSGEAAGREGGNREGGNRDGGGRSGNAQGPVSPARTAGIGPDKDAREDAPAAGPADPNAPQDAGKQGDGARQGRSGRRRRRRRPRQA